jgi:hypothetical protein
MRPSLAVVALTAAVAASAVLGSSPARALPAAHGSFGFVPLGAVVADTGDLTPATATLTYPARSFVNTVAPGGNLPVSLLDAVTFSSDVFHFAPGLGSMPVDLTVSVDGLTLTFTRERTFDHQANFLSANYTGTLTDASGLFATGTPATLSLGCDQAGHGAAIDCSNTTALVVGPIAEPGTLGLLGAALLGFIALRRRVDRPLGTLRLSV